MSQKPDPADPLAAYAQATGLSDAAIGRLIGVSRWKIGRARRRELPLSMEEQVALEQFTNVTPAQWAEYFAAPVREGLKPATLKKSPVSPAEAA